MMNAYFTKTLNIQATHPDTAMHKCNVKVELERYDVIKCDFPDKQQIHAQTDSKSDDQI